MTQPAPYDTVQRMIGGSLVSQLVYVAAKLNFADCLVDGPRTAAELAALVEADPAPLHRVLRALASLGIFAQMCGEILWPAFGGLPHSVRTGQPAFEHLHGMGVFEYFRQHPQAGEMLDAAMADLTGRQAAGIVAAYGFGGIGILVDVGGGQGGLLAAALRAVPATQGVLYERPEVIPAARRALEAAGVLGRCELKRGDFFSAVRILENCAKVLRPASRLLVIERTIPPGNEAASGKLVDVTMLAVTGGRERTEAEYTALMTRAGLRLVRVVSTPGEMQVLEAVGRGRRAA